MLKVLRNWVHRYFSDEQAVVLAVILLLGFTAILTLGGMLAPVLAGLVLAFLMQGLVNLAERLRLSHTLAVWLVFTLFIGLLAVCLLVLLMIAANRFGGKINVSEAYPVLRPRTQLYLGAAVGLVMIFMIGRGVMMGIATSTEISAFAVIYAIVVGRLAFRELTFKATVKMFIDIAAMSGVLLFIVACATSLSYALTIQMIPQQIAELLVSIGVGQGAWLFLLLTIVILVPSD